MGSETKNNNKFSPIAVQAVVVAMGINLLAGAQYCWSLLGNSVGQANGWTTTQLALPYSLMMVVTSLWAIIMGFVNDRSKPKYGTIFGGICIAVSLCIAGTTKSYVVLFLAIALIMGFASTSLTSNTSPTAMKFAPMKYKGLVSGIVGAGMGWTSLYMAPLIHYLNGRVSIKTTFYIIGLGCGGLIILLSLFLPTPPKIQEGTVTEEDTSIYKNTIDFKGALRKHETWVLFAIFCMAGMTGMMMTSQMTKIATVQIPGWTGAYLLIMALAGANGAGRLIVSGLSDRIGVFNTWKMIFAVQTANMILFRFYQSPAALILGTIVMGLFYGASIPLCWSTIASVYGKKYMSSIYGVITNGFAVAALVGPLLAARIVDTSGSYSMAFLAIAAFQVLGLVLSFVLERSRKRA